MKMVSTLSLEYVSFTEASISRSDFAENIIKYEEGQEKGSGDMNRRRKRSREGGKTESRSRVTGSV